MVRILNASNVFASYYDGEVSLILLSNGFVEAKKMLFQFFFANDQFSQSGQL